jgi:hypothetical protein
MGEKSGPSNLQELAFDVYGVSINKPTPTISTSQKSNFEDKQVLCLHAITQKWAVLCIFFFSFSFFLFFSALADKSMKVEGSHRSYLSVISLSLRLFYNIQPLISLSRKQTNNSTLFHAIYIQEQYTISQKIVIKQKYIKLGINLLWKYVKVRYFLNSMTHAF